MPLGALVTYLDLCIEERVRGASALGLNGLDLVVVTIPRECSLCDEETGALCEAMARDEFARRDRVLRNIVTSWYMRYSGVTDQ